MTLELLPFRTGGAAENMAVDFLLLQRYPALTPHSSDMGGTPMPRGTGVSPVGLECGVRAGYPRAAAPRFRHYGWHRPAFTFGYSQKISFVQTQLPTGERFDLCRRPTGGGVVDHRDDWTYALVIPRGHPLEELRATQSYREVHEALAAALRAQGVPAVTKQVREPDSGEVGPAGVCFQRAEIFDVVHERSGKKIAGAAQKRNKQGLLFQGSIWRPAAGGAPYSAEPTKGTAVDWEKFYDDFVAGLAKALGVAAEPTPWPDLNEDEVSALVEHYSTPEWNAFR